MGESAFFGKSPNIITVRTHNNNIRSTYTTVRRVCSVVLALYSVVIYICSNTNETERHHERHHLRNEPQQRRDLRLGLRLSDRLGRPRRLPVRLVLKLTGAMVIAAHLAAGSIAVFTWVLQP